MKLIKPESKIWGECPTSIDEAILWIEKAGRICYRSEDKIIEGSGKKFVDGIIKRGHLAVIEHSNLVIRTKDRIDLSAMGRIGPSSFLHKIIYQNRGYIGGNYRAWMEALEVDHFSKVLEFYNYSNTFFEIVTDPDKIPFNLKMITVEFITDRAVTHELVRHRPASYCQESQRYVAYGKIKFIKPSWYDEVGSTIQECFCSDLEKTEMAYNVYRKLGLRPEQARVILPNSTATKIVMTASLPEWKLVFSLRCSKAAYPDMRNLMLPVEAAFKENDWV